MLKYSEPLRSALMVTAPLRDLLTGGEIRIYDGPIPSSPESSIGASNVLVVIKKDGTDGVSFEETSSGGTLTKSTDETWIGTCIATGTATYFRFVMPGDDNATSLTAHRIQGTVAIAGADMNLTNPSLSSGAPQAISYFFLTMPEF